jgi:hypothetical protein
MDSIRIVCLILFFVSLGTGSFAVFREPFASTKFGGFVRMFSGFVAGVCIATFFHL